MKILDLDLVSDRRTRVTIVVLMVMVLLLTFIGLFGHPAADENGRIVWKSAPYGEASGTARH
jgi:hypothetical protein